VAVNVSFSVGGAKKLNSASPYPLAGFEGLGLLRGGRKRGARKRQKRGKERTKLEKTPQINFC